MKLQYLKMYDTKDVPDYIIEEMVEVAKEMVNALIPILGAHDPNVILGALNFMHASLIKNYVSDKPEEIDKGAKMSAYALIKNIELLTKVKND